MKNFFDAIEWSPTIGDPTFMGWFTVLAYFACAYKAYRVTRDFERIFTPPVIRQKWLWVGLTAAMVLLGINKQLDLQTFFTATARWLAMEQGWYGERRNLQVAFIAVIGVVGLACITFLLFFYRLSIQRHLLAIIGAGLLVVFVFARATSFHHMDHLIGMRVLGLKLNWVLELGGIALIFINARKLLWQRRPLVDLSSPHSHTPPGHSDEHSD